MFPKKLWLDSSSVRVPTLCQHLFDRGLKVFEERRNAGASVSCPVKSTDPLRQLAKVGIQSTKVTTAGTQPQTKGLFGFDVQLGMLRVLGFFLSFSECCLHLLMTATAAFCSAGLPGTHLVQQLQGCSGGDLSWQSRVQLIKTVFKKTESSYFAGSCCQGWKRFRM